LSEVIQTDQSILGFCFGQNKNAEWKNADDDLHTISRLTTAKAAFIESGNSDLQSRRGIFSLRQTRQTHY
jgi:hypothetical protein